MKKFYALSDLILFPKISGSIDRKDETFISQPPHVQRQKLQQEQLSLEDRGRQVTNHRKRIQ